jgi:hypothetical protein
MNRGTQNSIEGRARDVQGTVAGDVVGHPWPPADGGGGQAVNEAWQRINEIRRILGQCAFGPAPSSDQRRP